MRQYLYEANYDLLHQIEVLLEVLGQARIPGELTPYSAQVATVCSEMRQQAKRNLKDLEFNLPDTFSDILAATQNLGTFFELVNSRLAQPIVRANEGDRLGLLILRWLHDSRPKTNQLPFALADGVFAIYPTPRIPPVYLLPVSRQRTLLYLPLLFHEYGHLLYACHLQEMDELVNDFRKLVVDYLAPRTVRDNVGETDVFRQAVVDAWYPWVQEIFCDGVGLTIGGPCFLKAFSHGFRARSAEQYYVPRDKLLARRHPVTWLRVKMLVDRARKDNLAQLADGIEQAWNDTAVAMGIREDYEGTWSDELFVPLRKTLDDMLEESQLLGDQNVTGSQEAGAPDSPIALLNEAWDHFEKDPASYRAWERAEIDTFLKTH